MKAATATLSLETANRWPVLLTILLTLAILSALPARAEADPSQRPARLTPTQIKNTRNNKTDSIRYKYSPIPRIESIVNNTKLIYTDGKGPAVSEDSIFNLINSFYMNQYRHSQDPDAPYFMFMSRDASMALGVGGILKLNAWFDWNGTINSRSFSPYSITIPKDPANPHALGASAASSSIFFTLLGQHAHLGNYMGYVQMDFSNGTGYGAKLKKAYLTIQNWTVGYASSTFSDPGAEPPVLEGSGVNGKISKTNTLVRYVRTFKRFTVAGSFEFPSSKIQSSDYTAKSSDWLPDFAFSGQYNWDKGLSHIKLSAMVRSLSYRDMVQEKNKTNTGWGVMLSSVVSTPSPFTLYGIVSVGQGHESYTNDMSGGNYDLIADPYKPGHLYAPLSSSYNFGAQYMFSPTLFGTLALSELSYHPKHAVEPGDYKYGLYGAVNLRWYITPRLMLGGEYVIGKRQNFDGSHGSVNRIDALLQLNF